MLYRIKEAISTEVGIMCLVVFLYLLKVPAKLALGLYIHSPVIYGDAWHNLADMVQSILVICAIFFRRIPSMAVSLVLAGGLIYTACDIGISSWGGVLQNFPMLLACVPEIFRAAAPQALVFGREHLPLISCVLILGTLFSFLVGRWQLKVGRDLGNDNVVLNGKETLGDSAIELAVLAGIMGEYMLNIPWLEYPLGLVIAAVLLYAGVETLCDHFFGKG